MHAQLLLREGAPLLEDLLLDLAFAPEQVDLAQVGHEVELQPLGFGLEGPRRLARAFEQARQLETIRRAAHAIAEVAELAPQLPGHGPPEKVRLIARRAQQGEEVTVARLRQRIHDREHALLGGVHRRARARHGTHAARVVEDHDVMRRALGQAEDVIGRSSRPRDQERRQRHQQHAQQEQQQLLEARPPAVLLERAQQELHRGPTHSLEAAPVQDVDDQRDRCERRAPEQQRVQKGDR
jgi:hypothetical protein